MDANKQSVEDTYNEFVLFLLTSEKTLENTILSSFKTALHIYRKNDDRYDIEYLEDENRILLYEYKLTNWDKGYYMADFNTQLIFSTDSQEVISAFHQRIGEIKDADAIKEFVSIKKRFDEFEDKPALQEEHPKKRSLFSSFLNWING